MRDISLALLHIEQNEKELKKIQDRIDSFKAILKRYQSEMNTPEHIEVLFGEKSKRKMIGIDDDFSMKIGFKDNKITTELIKNVC